MSAAALYRAMGLKGDDVEDSWLGGDGALYVQVSVPRGSLRCRHFRCRHVLLCHNQGTTVVIKPGREFHGVIRNRIDTVLDRHLPLPGQETLTYSPPIAQWHSLCKSAGTR